MGVDLEDLHVGDRFYDAIGDLVPQLSGSFLTLIYLLSVCRCWIFILNPVVVEASLTFAWCTWLSSWCVEMVLHGMWRRFFFIVCGDGCILRTNGVLGKSVVYAFI